MIRIRPVRTILLAALLLYSTPHQADAQDTPAQNTISAAVGVADFDLSGTGQTWVIAVRGTRALTDRLVLELGSSFMKPDQQFGGSTFIAPDVHLQYWWLTGRVRPYAGGGLGFAYQTGDFIDSKTDFTLSVAGGVRIDVNRRTAVLAEMRVRGIEADFTGTTTEWVGGLSWRLGAIN